jgi:hypothetical protein
MAYSDFTFAKLKKRFKITQESVYLFQDVVLENITPSTRLLEDIKEAEQMPMLTEKAKSEYIIAPFVKDLKRRYPYLSIFSGYTLNIDVENELNGAPDFLISKRPKIVEIEAPVFCIMETKNKTVEEGYAQCAAEMYAASLFNQQMEEPLTTIYGAVTNGFDWVFLKYKDNCIQIDMNRYYLGNLPQLLGVMDHIIRLPD